jgi:hypothetical protein
MKGLKCGNEPRRAGEKAELYLSQSPQRERRTAFISRCRALEGRSLMHGMRSRPIRVVSRYRWGIKNPSANSVCSNDRREWARGRRIKDFASHRGRRPPTDPKPIPATKQVASIKSWETAIEKNVGSYKKANLQTLLDQLRKKIQENLRECGYWVGSWSSQLS